MNRENTNTDKIISLLQHNKPQLRNPELLADNIMLVLPEKNKTNTVIFNIRILSGVAAVFLLALFVFQQNDTKTLLTTQPSNYVQYKLNEKSFKRFQIQSDKSAVQMYRCYLNQNTIKNQKFRTFNNKISKNNHENFD